MEGDDDSEGTGVADALKVGIIQCFAAMTEKCEDARLEFVQNSEAISGLIQIIGLEPKLTTLQLSAFDLLRSLGRAKLSKKRIIREKFTEKKVNFVERISK